MKVNLFKKQKISGLPASQNKEKQYFIWNRQLLYNNDDETQIERSNITTALKDRETTAKRIMPTVPGKPIILGRRGNDGFDISLHTIEFPFVNNELKLTRYFNNNSETITEFIDKLQKNNKPIYRIETYDNYLVFDTYTNIVNLDNDAQESYTSYLEERDLIVHTNIYGNIIDVNNTPQTYRTYLGNNIDLIHFIFKDTNDNYYYINYTAHGDIFTLFRNVYDKTLELLLYKNVILRNKQEVENFVHQFVDHKDQYYATDPRDGGRKSGKRILKKYV